jgi:antitoxin component of MazEF toxin-antitoxin module
MIKTLVRHGNSYALIIDRPVMDLLGIDPESPLQVTTDGRSLVVEQATPQATAREAKFRAGLADLNQRYPKTMRKLAGKA